MHHRLEHRLLRDAENHLLAERSSKFRVAYSRRIGRWVRGLAIEIAWGWLRHQPDSALTHWYNERFARGGSRARQIGIVALARKLLVALWRYTETGALPEGAVLKA